VSAHGGVGGGGPEEAVKWAVQFDSQIKLKSGGAIGLITPKMTPIVMSSQNFCCRTP
jgi:hypothetical protein